MTSPSLIERLQAQELIERLPAARNSSPRHYAVLLLALLELALKARGLSGDKSEAHKDTNT